MSTWRDIWRYGVIANRLYSEDEKAGKDAFDKLCAIYDKPKKLFKDGRDGMIRYIMAEAYELKYEQFKNIAYKTKAIDKYKQAERLFPVEHWKQVARDSQKRLNTNQSCEDFFNIKFEEKQNEFTGKIEQVPTKDTKFEDQLWYGFQKVYGFVHLNDFARYVCLSALSRGSSEWPLSLVDFRTVLELEIKQCFPGIIKTFNDKDKENRYSLFKTIQKLKEEDLIDDTTEAAFNNIRIAGNISAHNLYADENYKKINVARFIEVLDYFNNFRGSNNINTREKFDAPLCQLTKDEFINELEKKTRKI